VSKPDDRFEVSATASSHFAWLRTRMALERTLMAWARTSVSLIGFGFTIVQFFQRVQTSAANTDPVLLPNAPRDFGLALIGAGILGLLVSLWQYRLGLHYLWRSEFRAVAGMEKERVTTPIMWVSILLVLVGMFAFFVVLFRWA
jgi:putative membrane protein